MHGLITDIQRFSIHDGPGIRTLVFFKGCPLSCIWCQNPESIDPNPQLGYNASKCIKCKSCSKACPTGAIKKIPKNYDKNKCLIKDNCTSCVDACPSGALEIAGKRYTVGELMNEILKDEEYYKDSGGGVTCSGGEPTFQWPFVREFLKSCKARGISTAMETCGFFNSSIIDEIISNVDVVLFDIKHLDSKEHERLTGKPNETIIKNFKRLHTIFKKEGNANRLVARMPLIPTINDDPKYLAQVDDFLKDLDIKNLVILPYHTLYIQKIDQFYLSRKKLKIKPHEKEELEKVTETFKNVTIHLGG
ncbi:MAG: glycyl-radical enzyme activating protein [Promethearchaeota archaeon]